MGPRKKVIHIIPTLERGGSEMSQLRMLPLTSERIEHVFIALKNPGSLASQFEQVGIKVYTIQQKGFWDIPSYGKLKQLLREIKADLIITHLLYADIVGRFFIQWVVDCKVISSLATTYNFPEYWPARLFERLTKYIADGYIANAEIVKKTYVNKFGVSQEKITVLTTGMDTHFFRNLEPDRELEQTLGIQPDDTVIICVANLHINKGHTYLLSAFEQIIHHYPKLKLLLVGDGKERHNLEQQVATYQSKSAIHFLGKRNDVPKLLRLSHIFVLPTFFEGMCNAIMEAMTSHLAVITTDISENQELITHEETGLLCPVRDIPALVQSLERLLKDPVFRTTLGTKALESIEKRYDLKQTAKRWEQFFLTHA